MDKQEWITAALVSAGLMIVSLIVVYFVLLR